MAAVLIPFFAITWAIAETAGWAWAWIASVLLAIIAEAPFTALASRLWGAELTV